MIKYLDLIQTVGSPYLKFYCFSGDTKKKTLKKKKALKIKSQLVIFWAKMTSQLVIFRVFFFFFFIPQTLNLIFFPVNQLIKNSGLTYCRIAPLQKLVPEIGTGLKFST